MEKNDRMHVPSTITGDSARCAVAGFQGPSCRYGHSSFDLGMLHMWFVLFNGSCYDDRSPSARMHRFITSSCTLIVGMMLMTGCTKKPAFPKPAVIIDRPHVLTRSSSSQSFSSSAPVSATGSSSRPASLLIKVPFAPQSPFAVWDKLHEEACEEMSLIMVHHFLAGTSLSMIDAETEVQSMVAWERARNYADDVTAAQLGAIAESLYGYHARVLTDVTADSLRHELALGNPIIIPAAGRDLHNPFFSGAGPFYHMLVVIGYSGGGFITNDPGTKQGARYWYSSDVLMFALHDWIGVKELIATGPKNALVVELF